MLELHNVEVIYDRAVLVLKGISLAVREGQIVALLGPNGAGKSTTLKAISGLLKSEEGEISDGEIRFMGSRIDRLEPEAIVRAGIFQVMEGRRVFDDLTVDENILMGAYTRGDRAGIRRDRDLVFAYFPRLEERRRQLAGYLSGGEQQMLAIGRALMARAKLMLLDEPSLGLAPLAVKDIFAIIRRINQEERTTILLVEQNANLALSIAAAGYIMENGRIVLDGDAEKLRANEDVKRFYLGGGADGCGNGDGGSAGAGAGSGSGGRRSYRELKFYKRRKRWLS
jgi:branched-chain amino acid transport system ATP-binding protein